MHAFSIFSRLRGRGCSAAEDFNHTVENGASKGAVHHDLVAYEGAARNVGQGSRSDHDGAGQVPLAALEQRVRDRCPLTLRHVDTWMA